jgi:hypothetical protein
MGNIFRDGVAQGPRGLNDETGTGTGLMAATVRLKPDAREACASTITPKRLSR